MANATTTTPGSVILAGDLTGTATSPALRPTGVTAGAHFPQKIWVDAKGRVLKCSTDLTSQSAILPQLDHASDTVVGIVKTATGPYKGLFNNTDGLISVPLATHTLLGLVKADGTTITITNDFLDVVVPDANSSIKGQVQIGTNIDVSNAVISIQDATTSVKGVVSVGQSMSINAGVLSAPDASTTKKGMVQITEGNGLVVTNGVISYTQPALADATYSAKGVVQIGSNISVNSGVISIDWPNITIQDATPSVKGVMKFGDGLSVSNGNVTLNRTSYATDQSGGLVKVGSSLSITDGSVNTVQNIPLTSNANTFSKAQIISLTERNTISGSVDVLPTTYGSHQLLNLTGDTVFVNSTDALLVPGCILRIFLKQDATGSRAVTFDTNYKIGSGYVITDPNATTLLTMIVVDSSTILVVITPDWI